MKEQPKRLKGTWEQHEGGYDTLAIYIIKDGVKTQGADYLCTPCGQWWCELIDIEPAFIYRKVYQERGKKAPIYKPLDYCPICKEWAESLPGMHRRAE